MSYRVSHFGISFIRFQASKMNFVPLLFISSLANQVSDFACSTENLEKTVSRQIKFSGLRIVRLK